MSEERTVLMLSYGFSAVLEPNKENRFTGTNLDYIWFCLILPTRQVLKNYVSWMKTSNRPVSLWHLHDWSWTVNNDFYFPPQTEDFQPPTYLVFTSLPFAIKCPTILMHCKHTIKILVKMFSCSNMIPECLDNTKTTFFNTLICINIF